MASGQDFPATEVVREHGLVAGSRVVAQRMSKLNSTNYHSTDNYYIASRFFFSRINYV